MWLNIKGTKRRAEMNIAPSKKAKLYVVTKYESTFRAAEKMLIKLASASEVIIADSYDTDDAVMIATEQCISCITMQIKNRKIH